MLSDIFYAPTLDKYAVASYVNMSIDNVENIFEQGTMIGFIFVSQSKLIWSLSLVKLLSLILVGLDFNFIDYQKEYTHCGL